MDKEDRNHWIIFLIVALTVGGLLMYALNSFSVTEYNNFVPLPKRQAEPEMLEVDLEFTEDGEIDTSDWKTYQNEEYGFESKYPPAWIVIERLYPAANDIDPPHGSSMSVVFSDNVKMKSFGSRYTTIAIRIDDSLGGVGMQGFTPSVTKLSVEDQLVDKIVWTPTLEHELYNKVVYINTDTSNPLSVKHDKKMAIQFQGDQDKAHYFDALIDTLHLVSE